MQKPRGHGCGKMQPGWRLATGLLLGLAGMACHVLPSVADGLLQSSAAGSSLQLAQSNSTALNVAEIRACLCMEQQMTADHDDLDLRQDLLNERQQELANVDQQVQEQRANLVATDTVGQQVLKDLLAQQQSLRDLVQNNLRPAYNTKVTQLNDLVAKYNGQCVNRQRYTMDVKTAQQDLQCPKP